MTSAISLFLKFSTISGNLELSTAMSEIYISFLFIKVIILHSLLDVIVIFNFCRTLQICLKIFLYFVNFKIKNTKRRLQIRIVVISTHKVCYIILSDSI